MNTTNLYPTPTRVELARSIAAGDVLEYWHNGECGRIERKAMDRWWKATSMVNLLRSAGLCETHPEDVFMTTRRTVLTTVGEQWLAAAEPEARCCDQYGIGDHDSTEHGDAR